MDPNFRHPCACILTLLHLAGTCLAQPDAGQAGGEIARFDGHRVVRVEIRSASDLQTALALTDDVWSHQVRDSVDIRVTPEQYAALVASRLPHAVMIPDLQARIDAETAEVRAARFRDDPQWYENFHTYDEIKTYCQALAAANPGLAEYIVIGTSIQGRDIFGLRITGPGFTPSRPGVLYHAAQHAREWATPPTAVYLAERLLADYTADPETRHLVDNLEIFIVPVSNPDGYVYTWTNNRMWRKNRRDIPGSSCFGIDLNRNWGHEWGGQGASSSFCNDTYRGPSAFSEPETQALRDFTIAHPNIVGHHDIHSYGELLMHPWGYTSTQVPPADLTFFTGLVERMADAIHGVYARSYTTGPINPLLYPASGTSVDWMYGARAIKSVTTEVREDSYGFIMPTAEILPNATENYFAELELARSLAPPLPTGCYPNCDGSTEPPTLNVADFTCFLQLFAAGESAANCDASTVPPVLNVADFTCFLQAFAAGCP